MLFNVAEASVAAAMTTVGVSPAQQGAATGTRDRLLGAAASVIQDCAAIAASVHVSDAGSTILGVATINAISVISFLTLHLMP